MITVLARAVLAIPATSVESERHIGTAGRVATRRRAALLQSNANDITLLIDNPLQALQLPDLIAAIMTLGDDLLDE